MRNAAPIEEGGLIDPTQAGWEFSKDDYTAAITINYNYMEARDAVERLMWSVNQPEQAALLRRFGIARETVVQNLSRIMAQNGRNPHPEEHTDTPLPPEP